MNTTIQPRLDALRSHMKANGIYATVLPQIDPHQSEYLADHWQARRYMSGFTGSAGDLVVTLDKALLWTDSRYFIQAARQLDGTGIVLMKDGLSETPSIAQWLGANVPAGQYVGIDGMLFSHAAVSALAQSLAAHNVELLTDFDPSTASGPTALPSPRTRFSFTTSNMPVCQLRKRLTPLSAASGHATSTPSSSRRSTR